VGSFLNPTSENPEEPMCKNISENNSDIIYVIKKFILIFTNVSYEHYKMGKIQSRWQLSPTTDTDHMMSLHILYAKCQTSTQPSESKILSDYYLWKQK